MKKQILPIPSTIQCLALAAISAISGTAHGAIIINEVYSGGGGSISFYTRDYVELYNTGATPVDLTGFRITYASAAGNFGVNDVGTISSDTSSSVFIPAGGYFVLVSGAAGSGGILVPNPDSLGTTTGSMSATAGSVTLLDAGGVQLDTVGWGATTTTPDAGSKIKIEGGTGFAAPAPANTSSSISRTSFADTNVNSADFVSGTPTPQGNNLAIPETTSASLVLLSLGGLLIRRRRD